MFLFLLSCSLSRELRTLFVRENGQGDCFTSACRYEMASNIIRNGDTLIFEDSTITMNNYPNTISDLLNSAMFMNVTFIANDDTVKFDGRVIAGNQLLNPMSATRFCWVKFVGFSFIGFQKSILVRSVQDSIWPLIYFKNCVFEDNTKDLFDIRGGSFRFDNCIFRNNLGRPIKAVSEVLVEINDCLFENCSSLFLSNCDAIIRNCRFVGCNGNRGGAIYSTLSTLTVDGCKFIDNKASVYGGAIYIRESHVDLESEITKSSFIRNSANNGTDVYVYLSSLLVRENCFSGSENSIYVQESDIQGDNKYKSECYDQLEYRAAVDTDFFEPNPSNDLDIEIPVNARLEL